MSERLYARKGEMVVCENHHEIGRITRDVYVGDVMVGDMVESCEHIQDGEYFPTCKCGAFFTTCSPVGFIFKNTTLLH